MLEHQLQRQTKVSANVAAEDPVIIEREGPLLILTLNRPQRMNAFTGTMLLLISDACAAASEDDEIRCIILTGAGGNFSSGADLRAMAGDPDDPHAAALAQRFKDDPDIAARGFLKIGRPKKPIIAAVEGVAIAGGTEILLGTDIRVAGETARFGVSEARWSLYPMMGSAVRLPRQIGYTAAAEILLTGKHITAAEAPAAGPRRPCRPAGSGIGQGQGDRRADLRQRPARRRGDPRHDP